MKIPISSLSGARLCVMDGLVQKDGRREQGGNSEGFLWVLTTPCFFFLWHKQRTHTHTHSHSHDTFSHSLSVVLVLLNGGFSLFWAGEVWVIREGLGLGTTSSVTYLSNDSNR